MRGDDNEGFRIVSSICSQDGARAVGVAARKPSPRPTEVELQAKLDAARARLRELVGFGMKTWLPPVTLQRLREIRLPFGMLERLREERRRRGEVRRSG